MIGIDRKEERRRCAGAATLAILLAVAAPGWASADGGGSTPELPRLLTLPPLPPIPPLPLPPLPPQAEGLLQEGQRQLAAYQFAGAADAFRRANEAAGGKCLPCARNLVFVSSGNLAEAIEDTRTAIRLLHGNLGQGAAYGQLGDLLLNQSGSPEAVADAEQAYQHVVDMGPDFRAIGLLGVARARLQGHRSREAAAAAVQLLEIAPVGPLAGNARSIICTTGLAAEVMPPVRSGIPSAGAPEPRPAEDEPPLRVGGEVTKPVKLGGPPPFYTEQARKARLQGVVIVEGIIDRYGCVTKAHILKGMPMGLGGAALDAVQEWAFAPATLNGRPVRVYYTLTVNFAVDPAPAK